MSRPPNQRSSSAPTKSEPIPQPHRPAPPRPDGKPFPPPRPKSILSRFRRASQYDSPRSSSSPFSSPSQRAAQGQGQGDGREGRRGSLISIPTLERMRELERRDEVDVDWEKVKTLPRVCLIPPEGEFSSSR